MTLSERVSQSISQAETHHRPFAICTLPGKFSPDQLEAILTELHASNRTPDPNESRLCCCNLHTFPQNWRHPGNITATNADGAVVGYTIEVNSSQTLHLVGSPERGYCVSLIIA